MSIHLLRPPENETANAPQSPMHHVGNNAIVRASLNYNIVDNLAHSRTSMYALEVLKTFPT